MVFMVVMPMRLVLVKMRLAIEVGTGNYPRTGPSVIEVRAEGWVHEARMEMQLAVHIMVVGRWLSGGWSTAAVVAERTFRASSLV